MHASFKRDVLKNLNVMNLHTFKIRGDFCSMQIFRPRLDKTELFIHTRGETTNGMKRLVRLKRPGGNVLGAKRLGEEIVWGETSWIRPAMSPAPSSRSIQMTGA